jgi:hypothetical protein
MGGFVLRAGIPAVLVVATLTLAGGVGWLSNSAGLYLADPMPICRSEAGTESPVEARCAEVLNGDPFVDQNQLPEYSPSSGIPVIRLINLDDDVSSLSRFDQPCWRMHCELDPITTLLLCERRYN